MYGFIDSALITDRVEWLFFDKEQHHIEIEFLRRHPTTASLWFREDYTRPTDDKIIAEYILKDLRRE
jgi:hypothetical protein